MKRFWALMIVGLLAYAATGVYFVQPDEQAVVRRFGRMLDTPSLPGAHVGLPWGLDRVQRIKPREVKRVSLGPVALGGEALGSNAAQFLTGDRNLVNVRATVQYSISDPRHYLFQTDQVDRVVATAGQATLTSVLANESVDQVLTLGKQEVAAQVRERLQQRVDQYNLGIAVRSVDIGSVAPPPEVAEAFADVISALRQRDQQINQSQSYANRTLAQARAAAQRTLDQAQAYRDRLVRRAEGEAERFTQLLSEFEQAPELTAQRLYLETMAETLPRFRAKLIVDDGSDLDLTILKPPKPAANQP